MRAKDFLRKQAKSAGISKGAETKFHKRLDKLVHDTFGARPEEMKEDVTGLNVGDDVVITGPVEFEGETGVIDSFGKDNRFVVVNLYNHGKHSFNSSDVSYNDYADSNAEEAEMYDRDPDFRKWADSQVDEGWESGPDEPRSRERDPDWEYEQHRQEKLDAPYAKKEPEAKGYQVVSLDTRQPVVDTVFATKGEAMAYIQQNYGKNLAYRAINEGRNQEPGEAMANDGYVYSGKNLQELVKTLGEYMKNMGWDQGAIQNALRDKDFLWDQLYYLPRRMVSAGTNTLASAKKLWQFTNKYIDDLASLASTWDDHNDVYVEHKLGNLFKTSEGKRIKVGFVMGGGKIRMHNDILLVPVEFMYNFRGGQDSQGFVNEVMAAIQSAESVREGWESGPEERAPRERDPDAEYDDMRQRKLDIEAEKEWAKRPQKKVYTLLGRGPNYEPNYKFPGEYDSQEAAIAARAKLMADPSTPNPRDIGIHSYIRYLDENSVTPLRDVEDYEAKRKALQDIQMDPSTAKDPELKQTVQQRLAILNKQYAELKEMVERVRESRGHKVIATKLKNIELMKNPPAPEDTAKRAQQAKDDYRKYVEKMKKINPDFIPLFKMDEGLKDPEDNPCWKGYKPVGTKKKNGKTVPNCVPKK